MKWRRPKEPDVGLDIFIFLDDFTDLECHEPGCILGEGHIPQEGHRDVLGTMWSRERSI